MGGGGDGKERMQNNWTGLDWIRLSEGNKKKKKKFYFTHNYLGSYIVL